MRARTRWIAAAAIAAAVIGGTEPVLAAPLDNGHWVDTSSVTFSCEGTPVRVDNNVSGNYVFNFHGNSAFPYYRESVHGSAVYTNLSTGGTYTNVFTGNTADVQFIDNGDGTVTIVDQASGASRYYDSNGKFVLNDPGQTRFSNVIDYNGTPGDPSDDTVVPGSFQIVRASTGRNDTAGRDFCQDLVRYTS